MSRGSIYNKVRHLTNYGETIHIYDKTTEGNKENSGERLPGSGFGVKGPTGLPGNGRILFLSVCVWGWRASVYVETKDIGHCSSGTVHLAF